LKQRVAVISLTQDDDQTIELFEWTGLMISKADALNHQVTSLSDRMQAAEATIAELNSQLDQLVTSRKDHEDYLMANFVRVLNEKKLKIRNQQRLLAAGKIDPEKSTLMWLSETFWPGVLIYMYSF
jgi:predicted  nucleic acid-binding Zn-ribbon protein